MEYLEEYLNYIYKNKGVSEKTIESYEKDLNAFFKFLSQSKGQPISNELIKSATRNDGRSYIASMECKATTKNRHVVSIRQFYSYLEDSENIRSDIVRLERVKTEKTLPQYLTLEEAKLFLRTIESQRDYTMAVLFLNCGFRVSELVSLDRSDIRGNKICVKGKGSKQRTIYLNSMCMETLNDYLSTRNDAYPCLFLSARGTRLSINQTEILFKGYFKKIGRPELSCHKLRHTFATLMYQSGSADVLQLKEMLGHESIATTQIYTHVVDEKLQECVENNPLCKPQLKVLAS